MKKNMLLVQIQDMHNYNRWANVRILDTAAKLSNEDFIRDLQNSYPSIRDPCTHDVGRVGVVRALQGELAEGYAALRSQRLESAGTKSIESCLTS